MFAFRQDVEVFVHLFLHHFVAANFTAERSACLLVEPSLIAVHGLAVNDTRVFVGDDLHGQLDDLRLVEREFAQGINEMEHGHVVFRQNLHVSACTFGFYVQCTKGIGGCQRAQPTTQRHNDCQHTSVAALPPVLGASYNPQC